MITRSPWPLCPGGPGRRTAGRSWKWHREQAPEKKGEHQQGTEGPTSDRIAIKDQDDTIEIGFADIEKYHGQGSIGGAAIAFKALQAAFAALFPDRLPRREELAVTSGHPGPGIRDAVEMVTRTVTRGTYTVETTLPKARWNPYRDQSFTFLIATADGRRAEAALKEGIVPVRFFALWDAVLQGKASAEEQWELDALKRGLAEQLLARPASELFTVEVTGVTAEPRIARR
jgi:hypothetical protein